MHGLIYTLLSKEGNMETLMKTFGNMSTSPGPENFPFIFCGGPHVDDDASLHAHQIIECS